VPLRRLQGLIRPRHLVAIAIAGLGVVAAIAIGHGFVARQHADLEPWHLVIPDGEPTAREIDAGMDLASYREREAAVLGDARTRVAALLTPAHEVYGNRYAPSVLARGDTQAQDWNRSFEWIPDQPLGRVLLLHGMTDGPYSLRALGEILHAQGFHVLAPRLQGHGTTPAALLHAPWEDWAATTRMAMRHLAAAGPADTPLVIVGYSTGAALALDHQLAALADDGLPRADRIVLLSPLIGLGRTAALAPLLSLLDAVPGFEKAAWLDVQPEYNPFKYNSFPINGGWQSHRLVSALAEAFERASADGSLTRLPPLLGFHSVIDTTVASEAVVRRLYDRLPANGSELVLYDLNRWNAFAPLFKRSQLSSVEALFDKGPRSYRLSVISNRDPGTLEVDRIHLAPGAQTPVREPLAAAFPPEVYSLSHTALPFPCNDPLYGTEPRQDEDFGVRLGTLALRGERHALQVSMEQLARLNCNPFFDDLAARVLAWAVAGPGQ
jgi:alpha-beta hydrolase superfamily lysophospholipase